MKLDELSTVEIKKNINTLLKTYNDNFLISHKKYDEYKNLQAQEEKKLRLSAYFLGMLSFFVLGVLSAQFMSNTVVFFIILIVLVIILLTTLVLIYGVLTLISYNRVLSHRIRILLVCILFNMILFPLSALITINSSNINLTTVIIAFFSSYTILAALLNVFQNFLEKKIFLEIEFYVCQKRYINDKYYEDIFKYETMDKHLKEETLLKQKAYAKKIKEYQQELKKRKRA